MPWWKKTRKTTDVDVLLKTAQDWKPYAGTEYDKLRIKAEKHCSKAQQLAKPIRWWQFWRLLDTPCTLLACKLHKTGMSWLAKACVGGSAAVFSGYTAHLSTGPGATVLGVMTGFCVLVSFLFVFEEAMDRMALRREHVPELERLRTRLGYVDTLTAYMLQEARKARAALIGVKAEKMSAADLVAELASGTINKTPNDEFATVTSPLRVAERKLANRLEEIRALSMRVSASLATEKDERLIAVLRSGLDEAAELEAFVAGMKAKVDERIAQIKAFFDECEARIMGLDAPIRVMALKAELTMHRTAAEGEVQQAEQAITNALIELQAKWLVFQQTANTLLPPVVAKVFGEMSGCGDEKQNLETLEAAMDRVFDTLPARFSAAQDKPFDDAQGMPPEPVRIS